MLLRISLVVAIVAGIATFLISHLQVGPKIVNLQSELSMTQNNLAQSEEARAKAQTEAKEANDRADRLDRELVDTKDRLETQTARANTQEARANQREAERDEARRDLTETQRNLAAWRALGIPVETVRERLAELVKANLAIAGMTEENRVLLTKLTQTQNRLNVYEGESDRPPDMSLTRKGKVLAVDPQWDFVIVDLGSNDGAVERGEMLVNRDGKLVAKVRLSRVEETQSVANVLPEWKQTDVEVGDEVLK